MKTINDNIFDGILLEDPIVEDTVPASAESEFNPVVALAATFGPVIVTFLAWTVIGEFAVLVWLLSVLAGTYYTVRRMSVYQGIFALVVYWVLLLFEFIALAASVPGLLVLHGE